MHGYACISMHIHAYPYICVLFYAKSGASRVPKCISRLPNVSHGVPRRPTSALRRHKWSPKTPQSNQKDPRGVPRRPTSSLMWLKVSPKTPQRRPTAAQSSPHNPQRQRTAVQSEFHTPKGCQKHFMLTQSEPQDPRNPPYSGPESSSDHIIFVTLHKAVKWLVGFTILLTRVFIIQFHTAGCLYIYMYMFYTHSFFDVHPHIFLLLCIMHARFMLRLLVVACCDC